MCGGHTALSCGDCPQGHGRIWCNGECIWAVDDNTRCLPKIPNQKWKWGDGTNWHEAGNKVKVRCGYKPKGINTIIFMHKEQTVNFSFIFPLIFECGF